MLNIKLTLTTLMLYYNYNPKYILFYMPHSLDKKSFSTQTLNISSSNNKIKFHIYIYKNTYTYKKNCDFRIKRHKNPDRVYAITVNISSSLLLLFCEAVLNKNPKFSPQDIFL